MKGSSHPITIIKNNAFMLKYVFRYTPGLLIYMVIMKVISGIVGVLQGVYTLNYIVDAFQQHKSISQIAGYLVFFIGCNVVSLTMNMIYQELYYPRQQLVLAEKMQLQLYNKAISLDLARYDNPQFYNDFIWAMSQSEGKVLQVLESTGVLIESFTAIASVGTLILLLDPIGIMFVAVSFLVNMGLSFATNKISYQQDIKTKELQRKRDYTNRVLYQADYAKEVRLSDVEEKLIEDFKDSNAGLIAVINHYFPILMKIDLFGYLFSRRILLDGIYMLLVVYKALVLKTLSYGAVIGLLRGVNNLQGNLSGLSEQIPLFVQYSLYIEKFRKFLECEPSVVNQGKNVAVPGKSEQMEVKDVSFTYDGNEEPTLSNISFHIKPGEKIALVGHNGAGKSTLIKLILRLYDASKGKLLLEGRDIKEYTLESYRNMFGVVFQDYQLFAASIGENVVLDRSTGLEEDIIEALDKSGFRDKLESLPDGIYTQLTREFYKTGVNLSGGEGQKVAIARVFQRNCSYVILDEPSSALDPQSEYEINQRMFDVANQKTVIFISHRLSSTVMADRIFMLEKGKIIESGSHLELMQQNGKYATMFRLQAEKYLKDFV